MQHVARDLPKPNIQQPAHPHMSNSWFTAYMFATCSAALLVALWTSYTTYSHSDRLARSYSMSSPPTPNLPSLASPASVTKRSELTGMADGARVLTHLTFATPDSSNWLFGLMKHRRRSHITDPTLRDPSCPSPQFILDALKDSACWSFNGPS